MSDEEIHDNFFIPTDYSILVCILQYLWSMKKLLGFLLRITLNCSLLTLQDNQNEGEQQPQPEEVAEAASQDDLNEVM